MTHLASDREWGVGSMVAPLKRVLVRQPATSGDFLGAGWREPDAEALVREHREFVELLQSLGCTVDVLPAEPGLVDATYTHDPVIMTPAGAIILQMTKPARRAEPAAMRRDLTALGVPIVGELTGEARSDGGDKVWLDPHTLLMGRGYRTNAAAIAQVREIVAAQGIDVVPFDLPHYRGREEVLHLMSVISPVADDLAVFYEPLAPVALIELAEERGITRIPVDDDEFATQGGNVLAVAPRVVVIPAGNPKTAARLRDAGCEVHEFAGNDLAVKGDGGPTCLTRPLLRA